MMAQIADVNLEFAHVSFAHVSFDKGRVTESANLASDLLSKYRRKKLICSISILIDDKHVRRRLTMVEVRPFLQFVSTEVRQIDYICFEKRLSRYADQMLGHIRPEKREYVKKEMIRYRRKHGRIACSHDIAIWHLMRLGLIEDIDVETLVPVGALNKLSRMSLPFVSKRAISILSEEDREPEDRAVRDVLRYCSDDTIVNRIEQIYF